MVIMKNFTVENVDLDGLLIAVATDETGADWYASQRLFQPDTLKFVFDKNGVVISMNHDVSALWPGGNSVAELAADDIPAEFCLNGEWVFDGKRITPRAYTAEEWQARAQSQRQRLLTEASTTMTVWDREKDAGILDDDDKASLIEWTKYAKALRKLDISAVKDAAGYKAVIWPEAPDVA